MKGKKEIRSQRVNLVVTHTVGNYIKQVSEQIGISESLCYRAASNLLIRYLESHGVSSLQNHLKDVTSEEIAEGRKDKKVVNLSNYRGTHGSAYVFGCFSVYLVAFEFLRNAAIYLANRYR